MSRLTRSFQPVFVILVTALTVGCATRQREYLVATGLLELTNDSLHTQRFRKLRLREERVSKGAYTIELQDSTGSMLRRQQFEPMRHSNHHRLAPFATSILYHRATATIVLKRGEHLIASTKVSASAPAVRVTYPAGSETLRGEQTITWIATDPDGDSLRYDVLYSANGGRSWTAVAVNLAVPHYVWNTDAIGGSDHALVRVLASDGVNTTQARSPRRFRVTKKPPQVIMDLPSTTMSVFSGRSVHLQGWALDLEDGFVTGRALSWTSDIQGLLGNGTDIEVDSLRPGTHRVTLQARDRDGNTGSAVVTITALSMGDRDADSVGDGNDNCPLVHNSEQTDANANRVGDACDDSDKDGYVDSEDKCRNLPDDQADEDGDGIGDACEGDLDGDGDVDTDDLNVLLRDRGNAVNASHCGKACDFDDDKVITARDAERLRLLCTRQRCARR